MQSTLTAEFVKGGKYTQNIHSFRFRISTAQILTVTDDKYFRHLH